MTPTDEQYWQIALTLVPGMGILRIHRLVEHFKSAKAIFHAQAEEICFITQDSHAGDSIRGFDQWKEVEKTIAFVRQHQIKTIFLSDEAYPSALKECSDPPLLLYYKGNVSLNHQRILSIVGTRRPSDYGRSLTRNLLIDLAPYDVLIVSGLADGIDALAHQSALDNRLATIGVLGHGLDSLYPACNRLLARQMLDNGGLLTEFRQETRAAKYNFPRRNRIIAGMSVATVVMESPLAGGSMNTAGYAFQYNREVLAFPGRTTDIKSAGCLALIRRQQASLVTSAADIAWHLNWEPAPSYAPATSSTPSFPVAASTTTPDRAQTALLRLIGIEHSVHIDDLHRLSGLTATELAATLLSLELGQAIEALPGKRYRRLGT